MATPLEVAEWMRDKVLSENYMYQETVVYKISDKFGEQHVYQNDNGNLAISRKVLAEFRKLTKDTVVWERGERCWRKREKYNDPNKRQVE